LFRLFDCGIFTYRSVEINLVKFLLIVKIFYEVFVKTPPKKDFLIIIKIHLIQVNNLCQTPQ
jgi:hypothetical protein